MTLVPQRMYRLSAGLDKIAKRAVVFIEYRKRWFDINRAVVRLVNKDGSLGDEYLVAPQFVLPL